MKSMSRNNLVNLHLRLLKLEREEEIKRQEQLSEDLTLEMVVESAIADIEQDSYVLTVGYESKRRLPEQCLNPGSQVSVSKLHPIERRGCNDTEFENERRYCTGKAKGHAVQGTMSLAVVTKATPVYIKLTLSNGQTFYKGQTVLIEPTENTDYFQLVEAMMWLQFVEIDTVKPSETHAIHLVWEMFREHQQEPAAPGPDLSDNDEASPLRFINERLDESQREAVALALRDRRLTVIHGPPGTGKTTTLVEVILQHVQRGQRVLVCASSNKAVDNVLEGLWKQTRETFCGLSMENVLRFGQLARMESNHRQFSPKLQLEKRNDPEEELCIMIEEGTKPLPDKEVDEYIGIYCSFMEPDDDIDIENIDMKQLMKEASVVMSTLTSVRSVKPWCVGPFDLLVIDECAQATEAACWLAIPLARKVLLAGDPCQLPPTILSQEAARCGLAVSLMERQMELHGEGVVHMLDTQYRMHKLIQTWSSRLLYSGRLKASPEVASRLLTELPDVRSTERTKPTMLLVDTGGCKLKETRDTKTSSYRNDGEANLVVSYAKSLVKAGIREEDIGVITPYKQQVALIDGKMDAAGLDVEVNSVDGYQGREKEAILLSLVRSNERGQVGFVSDRRRLNVAVTRARRHLFVVCDTGTVCWDDTIRSLVKHMEENGEARSAYCEQCPRGKNGYSADDDDTVNDDVDADNISRLVTSLGTLQMERHDMSQEMGPSPEWPRLGAMNVKRAEMSQEMDTSQDCLSWGAMNVKRAEMSQKTGTSQDWPSLGAMKVKFPEMGPRNDSGTGCERRRKRGRGRRQ